MHYTELPPEGDLTTPSDPAPSWPDKGEIKFDHVEMAYRKGLPLVLKDVSFDIKAGEKVGNFTSVNNPLLTLWRDPL